MTEALRVLLVEDSATDAKLIGYELRRGGRNVELHRVEEEGPLRSALQTRPWDIVLSDWSMPHFSALRALSVVRELMPHLPFIIVSGAIGEEAATEAMRAGANDFVLKDRMSRLVPALERELREVEARQHSAAALRLSETQRHDAEVRFRALVEKNADLIVLIGRDGTLQYMSPAVHQILGHDPDYYVGQDWLDVFRADDNAGLRAVMTRLLEAPGGSASVECHVTHADGSPRWLDTTCTNLLDDPSVAAIVGNLRDVTERKRSEIALRKTEEQLRQAQKMEAIGNLAGGVAHDFNNLLSVILGYSLLLAEDLTPSDPRRADLEAIAGAGQHGVDLTRRLLAFSRQQILQPKIVNLNDVIAGLERMLRRLIGEDIELNVLAATGLDSVQVDPGQIEQVVMNLVVNSRDAMPNGGKLTIETSNVELDQAYADEHVGAKPGPHVMLAVTDTGVGMDRSVLDHMFEPFFTTKEKGKGTGLGLATVFGIVQQSRGNIWVYSEVGKGTTFKVYIPVAAAYEGGKTPTNRPTQLPKGALRGNETILLVEDDDRVRTLARSILRRLGYHVLDARSGGDALLICEQHQAEINLMITDVIMPRMSGRQLAERLRVVRPQMKVLFMSGYTDNSIIHHGVLDSGVEFLQKPITPDSLAQKVREVLDSPRPGEAAD